MLSLKPVKLRGHAVKESEDPGLDAAHRGGMEKKEAANEKEAAEMGRGCRGLVCSKQQRASADYSPLFVL